MDSFHHWLMKLHLTFGKNVFASAQKMGLTSGQPKILEFLDEVGSAEQKTIAQFCEIEPATVGGILHRMEESGLVTRTREKNNRRSIVVKLTDKGKQIAEEIQHQFDKWEEIALEGFDEEQRKMFRDWLKKCYNNLQNNEKEEVNERE